MPSLVAPKSDCPAAPILIGNQPAATKLQIPVAVGMLCVTVLAGGTSGIRKNINRI